MLQPHNPQPTITLSMLNSSYAPAEPGHIISDEVAWLQGAFFSSLLCGVQITLSTLSFLAVLRQRMRRRLRIALLIFIFFLCAIMTAGQQVSLVFIQTGFIEERDFPGGPNSFLSEHFSTPLDLTSTSLFVFANWMMDSLMAWRCKVVCCTGDKPMRFGASISIALLIGDYVTGILFFCKMLRGKWPVRYALIYSGVSVLLNFAVTVIIAVRLLKHRRRMMMIFGPGNGAYYASVATVLIESASLYTLYLTIMIILFCVPGSGSNFLQQAAAQVQCIASLLIIYRISQGQEWRDNPLVSTSDWRGSQVEAPVENAVVQNSVVCTVELVTNSGDAGGHHSASILSKDEAPASACSVDVTIAQQEVV